MDKIPTPMTPDFLLSSGYYVKVDFRQTTDQINRMGQNTPHIDGYKYTPSVKLTNTATPEILRPVKIIGMHSYRNNPVIIYNETIFYTNLIFTKLYLCIGTRICADSLPLIDYNKKRKRFYSEQSICYLLFR